MPKAYVDASLVANNKAFGKISGDVDSPVVPQVGDVLRFLPRSSDPMLVLVPPLRVTHRTLLLNQETILLSLEDLVAQTEDEARNFVRFLETEYSLFGEVWED